MKRLCVEGWRFLPHSYAMVNQWQLLSLMKRSDLSLVVRDAPYFRPHWTSAYGLFPENLEKALGALPKARPGEPVDATYRIQYPYDFSQSVFGRTVVFATSEMKTFWPTDFKSPPDFARLADLPSFAVVTPSNWSRDGLLRSGLRPDQVHVVPHGVDTDIFRPDPAAREEARRRLGLTGFTFGNASAMSPNKGIDLLFRAFLRIASRQPNVHLLLKGLDAIYMSRKGFESNIAEIMAGSDNALRNNIHYFGDTIPVHAMADFYRAIDVYVSPYLAEGFNLPVLEALACGTPVICTKGGSTGDFVSSPSALLIESTTHAIRDFGMEKIHLLPDGEHLVRLMTEAMHNERWRNEASFAGPRHARSYTWDEVTEQLVRVIFPPPG